MIIFDLTQHLTLFSRLFFHKQGMKKMDHSRKATKNLKKIV